MERRQFVRTGRCVMKEYRKDFDPDPRVLLRLLMILWESNREFRKNELCMAAGISYEMLRVYLPYMTETGLVSLRVSGGGVQFIRITNLGVEACRDMARWVSCRRRRRLG